VFVGSLVIFDAILERKIIKNYCKIVVIALITISPKIS